SFPSFLSSYFSQLFCSACIALARVTVTVTVTTKLHHSPLQLLTRLPSPLRRSSPKLLHNGRSTTTNTSGCLVLLRSSNRPCSPFKPYIGRRHHNLRCPSVSNLHLSSFKLRRHEPLRHRLWNWLRHVVLWGCLWFSILAHGRHVRLYGWYGHVRWHGTHRS